MYFTTQAAAVADGRPANAVGLARFIDDGVRTYQWVDAIDADELDSYGVDFDLLLAD